VAGEWSGRRLDAVPGTRPTAQRTREALFSIWSDHLEGASFLDLFCGSGAAALEALSRGALGATLVDADPRAIEVAERNRERLSAVDSSRVVRAVVPPDRRAHRTAGLDGETFDLVFADPPYDFDRWSELLAAVEQWLATDGEAAIEHAARAVLPETQGTLERFDQRRYGDSALSFYRRRRPAPG
jgi:16S rRNA (guanine966-N2)-methyltransferase